MAFDGLTEQIDWQCRELARIVAAFGGRRPEPLAADVTPRLATAVREAFLVPASVMRFALVPSQVAELIEQGASAARARGLSSAWTAHAGVGVATAALASPEVPREAGLVAAVLGDWRAIARANGGFATLEAAPLAVKTIVPVWDDLGATGRIMKRIKAQLDPKNVLNPGRFVGGL